MRISPSINVNKIPHHLYIQALNTKSMSAEHIAKKQPDCRELSSSSDESFCISKRGKKTHSTALCFLHFSVKLPTVKVSLPRTCDAEDDSGSRNLPWLLHILKIKDLSL